MRFPGPDLRYTVRDITLKKKKANALHVHISMGTADLVEVHAPVVAMHCSPIRDRSIVQD